MPALRPSLRDIARSLDISPMTVSRALRGQPGVSVELRRRVVAAARAVGYRPDPSLGRLMQHLRGRRSVGPTLALAGVTDIPQALEPTYLTRMIRHASVRAGELGFSFTLLRVTSDTLPWSTLPRVLRARGVDGVLLLPLVRPLALDALDWRAFSIVAATSSVLAPPFHRAIPDHAANARLLAGRLSAAGHRRIGFVGTHTHAERTGECFLSSLALHHSRLRLHCPPLLHASDHTPSIVPWVRTARPDVIVLGRPSDFGAYRRELAVAGLSANWALAGSLPVNKHLPALDERHDRLGIAAVDAVAGLIARGERGAPAAPSTIAYPGDWFDPALL